MATQNRSLFASVLIATLLFRQGRAARFLRTENKMPLEGIHHHQDHHSRHHDHNSHHDHHQHNHQHQHKKKTQQQHTSMQRHSEERENHPVNNIFNKKGRLSQPQPQKQQQPQHSCDPLECKAVVDLLVDAGAVYDTNAISQACTSFCHKDGSFTRTAIDHQQEGMTTLGGTHLLQLGEEAKNVKIALLAVFLESGCDSSDLTCMNHSCGNVGADTHPALASMEFEIACSMLAMEYGPLLVEKGSFPKGETAISQASQETTVRVCEVLFGDDTGYAEERGISCSAAPSSIIRA